MSNAEYNAMQILKNWVLDLMLDLLNELDHGKNQEEGAMRTRTMVAAACVVIVLSASSCTTFDTSDVGTLEPATGDSPESAASWTALGNAYFDSDQYSEAIDAYTRSLDIDSSNPNV